VKLGTALLPTGCYELFSGRVPNRAVAFEYKTLLLVDTAQPKQATPGELDRDQDVIRPKALPERGELALPTSNQHLFPSRFRKLTSPIERQTAQRGYPTADQRLGFHLVSLAIH
jgi:hypothetical protein